MILKGIKRLYFSVLINNKNSGIESIIKRGGVVVNYLISTKNIKNKFKEKIIISLGGFYEV